MIAKRGKVFWLDLWVGHGKDRKRVRRSLRTDERQLAIERARDITRELREPKQPGTNFSEFADKYLAWARQTKPTSVRAEEWRIAIIKSWLNNAGISTLDAIMPYHIEQFRIWLQGRKRPTSRSTANRYCALLRGMFNRARDWGLFNGPNPVSKVKFYREGEKVRPLTEAEIHRVLEAARAISSRKDATPIGRVLFDICNLVLQTGFRRSEVLNLRWTDIGDDELMIHGKGGKIRMVPLNVEARKIIEEQPRLGPFVFAVPNRNSLGVLRRVTETVSRRAGVHFHLHLLRHAFASRLLAAGVDVVTISDILGHSAHMTTLLYSHSSPARKREAVDKLSMTSYNAEVEGQ